MKKFSPSRRTKSRRAQRRSDEAGLLTRENRAGGGGGGGGDPFPQAPTVQIEPVPRSGGGSPGTGRASKAPAASPRGVADVQHSQASRPYRRRADRYADDVSEEQQHQVKVESEQDQEEEEEESNASYYDDDEEEEEEEGTHDDGEASSSSSASSDFRHDALTARASSRRHRRPASRGGRSLEDDDDTIDDTIDDTVDDTIDDDDDQSADSYMEGADLLGTGMLMHNVFAFGTFKGDDDDDNTLDDDEDDGDNTTVDGDDASVSSRDRKTLKLCYKLASNDYKLTEIDVDCSALTRETAREMAELLAVNTRLERMRIMASPSDGDTGSSSSSSNQSKTAMANFRHLVGGLAKNASITDLQIRGTRLTREAAGHLGRALAANASVTKLCLRSCHFADTSALPVLFLGMQQNSHIRELYVLQCDLSEPCNADVVAASVPLLKLQSLCLIDTRLTLSGLRFLADNIERTPSLAQLNLSINRRMGMPSAIRLLGRVLESTTMVNLTSVSLSSCSLDPSCVGELAEALVDNQTLTSLNLSGNRFGDDGARHLRYLLERNHNIKELVVKGCDITKRRQKAIDDGLKYNNSLLKSLFSKETSLSIFDAVTKIEEFGNSVTGAAKEGVEMARGGGR